MNGSDFAPGRDAQVGMCGNLALEGFDIDRDHQALLPFVQATLGVAGPPIELPVRPGSAPARRTSNATMHDSAQLRPDCLAVWVQSCLPAIPAHAVEGVPAWGVLIHSEPSATPWPGSCLRPAERAVVRDQTTGPSHVGNLCGVQLPADAATDRLLLQISLTALSCPGAWRVPCATDRQALEHIAFVDTDGGLAAVVINRGEAPAACSLLINGRAPRLDPPARAIATCLN